MQQREIGMYKNLYYDAPYMHVWDDKAGYFCEEYYPDVYVKDPNGEFVSIYGDRVSKKNVKNIIKGDVLFESDVNIITKYIIDKYGLSDIPSKNVKVCFIDIETDYSGGFTSAIKAQDPITSISLLVDSKFYVFLLYDGSIAFDNEQNVEFFVYSDEKELLSSFLALFSSLNIDIITGWNSYYYDIPYIISRINKLLGEDCSKILSPISIIKDNGNETFTIAGISHLDYLNLYKKFTPNLQPTYSLDFIGKKEVGLGKVEYSGKLKDLYRNDIKKFIEYNINDVLIVKKIDDKFKFIELARAICHKGAVVYEEFPYTSRWLDGAIIKHNRSKGVISVDRPKRKSADEDEKSAGAYTKAPQVGVYKYIFDLDAKSLYPSIIMTLNISPETKMAKILNWNSRNIESIKDSEEIFEIEFSGGIKKIAGKELYKKIRSTKCSLSCNGVIYSTSKKGFIPEVLEKWFSDRDEFKNLMKKYKSEGNKELAEFYNRRQAVTKVMLNSIFGVLGLPSFRYFDEDNFEATTITGQNVIKYANSVCNEYYSNKVGEVKDWVIYSDTDSIFISADAIIKKFHPDLNESDLESVIKVVSSISNEFENFVNNSFSKFSSEVLNCSEHKFKFKQESISDRGFFIGKKTYVLNSISQEGILIKNPEDRYDKKGIATVKSTFPPAYSNFVDDFMKKILSGCSEKELSDFYFDFKKKALSMDYRSLSRSVSVKDIDKWISNDSNSLFKSRIHNIKNACPIHVRSAINRNNFLLLSSIDAPPIKSGDNIKYIYLRKNPYSFASIAYKDDGEIEQVLNFVEKYYDPNLMFEKELSSKLSIYYKSLGYVYPEDKNDTLEQFLIPFNN